MRTFKGYLCAGLLMATMAGGCAKSPPPPDPADVNPAAAAGGMGGKGKKPSATERIPATPPPR
jgi:hypothetical protein